jgi:hypothetical protein
MDHKNAKSLRPLADDELEHVAGGQGISKIPDPSRPKPHVPGSIAQGDTLDNTLTFDQLP